MAIAAPTKASNLPLSRFWKQAIPNQGYRERGGIKEFDADWPAHHTLMTPGDGDRLKV